MKKREQIEIKIYETIGIKKFKKIIFKIRDAIYNTFHKKESKEENNKNLYEKQSNYVIGKKIASRKYNQLQNENKIQYNNSFTSTNSINRAINNELKYTKYNSFNDKYVLYNTTKI